MIMSDDDSSTANDYRSATEGYISFGAHVFLSVFCLMLLAQAIWHLIIKKTVKSQKYVKWSVILSVLGDFGFCVWATITSYFRNFSPGFPYICPFGIQIITFLVVARLFLYYFFLARFHSVFYGTVFDMTPCHYRMFMIGMFLTLVSTWLYMGTTVILSNCDQNVSRVGAGIGVLQDTVWTFSMCYLFCNRLIQVRRMTQSSTDGHQRDTSMMKINTKLAILSVVATATTVISTGLAFVIHNNLAYSIDVCINGLCLLLTFTFNKKLYKHLCCSCEHFSHYFCSKCCNAWVDPSRQGSLHSSTTGREFTVRRAVSHSTRQAVPKLSPKVSQTTPAHSPTSPTSPASPATLQGATSVTLNSPPMRQVTLSVANSDNLNNLDNLDNLDMEQQSTAADAVPASSPTLTSSAVGGSSRPGSTTWSATATQTAL